MINPLLDKDFLRLLDLENDKQIYAKIISLDMAEYPIEEISGKVTQGSVSIDGNSAVRRTCSLTLVTENVNVNNYYWGFSTKFKLMIGLKVPDCIRNLAKTVKYESDTTRTIIEEQTVTTYPYKDYPEIIWFPQGVYLVTNFKITYAINSCSIAISGKDKMCLLNGEIGGLFPSQTDLGVTEYCDEDDNITKIDNTLKNIIREMIHYYGGEPFHNIIINDLDNGGVELLDFQGDNLYLFKNVKTQLFENAIIDGDVPRYTSSGTKVIVSELDDDEYDHIDSGFVTYSQNPLQVRGSTSRNDTTFYTITKCEYGQAVGYRNTELTYAGDLIANAGDSITSILDKIVTMLGEYEYFYNLDGRFVFQKKLTYINTSWNNIVKVEDDQSYVESSKLVSEVQYSFTDANLITSFINDPNFASVKNDYVIWGKKKAADGKTEIDIHYRYAIDEKPDSYTQITVLEKDVNTWYNNDLNYFENIPDFKIENFIQDDPKTFSSADYDWREIIYQMAVDYLKYNHLDDFEIRLSKANPQYRNGKTGYEQYYTDLQGFWRLIYNPNPVDGDIYSSYYGYNYYTKSDGTLKYWNKLVSSNPQSLLFWFDFLDSSMADLGKYSVPAIGDRPKIVNDNDVKAIYYGETPGIIYITSEEYEKLKEADLINDGYTYIFLPENMQDYFTVSTKGKSAQDVLDSLVYQGAYCNESVNISCIPIYYLQPNTKISVFDSVANINGEYIINKITLPLSYNGVMQISATKAPIRLY